MTNLKVTGRRRTFLKTTAGVGLALLFEHQESLGDSENQTSPSGVLCCPDGNGAANPPFNELRTVPEFSELLNTIATQITDDDLPAGWQSNGTVTIGGTENLTIPQVRVRADVTANFTATGMAIEGTCDVTGEVENVTGTEAIGPVELTIAVPIKKPRTGNPAWYYSTINITANFSGTVTAGEGNAATTASDSACTYIDGAAATVLATDNTCTGSTNVVWELEWTLELTGSGTGTYSDTSAVPVANATINWEVTADCKETENITTAVSITETC